MTGVLACYLAFSGWEATHTPVTGGDFALFSALMCCGACCVEASGRLGQPTGVWRDLLSAWWLPVALLLPPLYALAAPSALGLLSYLRVSRGAVYRRIFSSAALGLSGALASAPVPLAPAGGKAGPGRGLADLPGAERVAAATAAGRGGDRLAVVFGLLNAGLVAVAAWLVDPDTRLSDMLWDRERMLLDLTETCVGILVTIACALSTLLLTVALPPSCCCSAACSTRNSRRRRAPIPRPAC